MDARRNDSAFAAALLVPAVVIAAIWAIATPTAAVGVAGVAVGATAVRYDLPGRIVGETPLTRRWQGTDAEASTAPPRKPVQ